MKSKKTKTLVQLAILAVFTAGIFYACQKEHFNQTGESRMDFYLTDAPCDYDHVYIDVQGMKIHTDSNGWEDLSPFNAGVYDLLELQNGLDTFLGSITLPEGMVSQIRLILGENNSIVVDSISYPLQTPSAQQSGLKLNLHMAIDANTTYPIWLDFDACKSIVKKGNGGYLLKPVIRAYTSDADGKLEGYVMPLNAGATVHAIENTDTFRAMPDTTGYWMIGGLDGTYDVWINPDPSTGLGDTLINGVSVPSGSVVDMDTITLH